MADKTIDESNGEIPTTNEDPALWRRISSTLEPGSAVSGVVLCRRHFGVFIDIGYGTDAAAVLLVPDMTAARDWPIGFNEYPLVGEHVDAFVRHISWERCKIALTQHQPVTATEDGCRP